MRCCWLALTYGVFLCLCWRLLGIPWTFIALSPNLFMASADQLDLRNNRSPRISLRVNVGPRPWEPRLPSLCFYAQLRTTVTGSNFHKSWRPWISKRIAVGCTGPLPEGPWESNCLFSLCAAQVRNLTCAPQLFTLKEFPLHALSGLLKDAPSFC